ncbi:YdcF family protein [Methylocystis bryophila]|uniref:DUF218 domain-containing protein n=1 Tax=Methylocystis bryophila TaxID=655015 RepID=A0A1W6MRK2_9HYPH|nr:YdcF family protein [Methylocystis bryophila]ARN80166.1 hypothetical protein B1812_02665 [Methylocystis bryophila]BDV40108.1 membrane protein [Methylocystis bryophila]
MFFVASKVLEFFFAPSHFVVFCVLVGAVLAFTRFRRFGAWLSLISALLLVLMGFGPLGSFLVGPLEARFPELGDDMEAPDGIIVLGGSVDEELSAERRHVVFTEAAQRLTAPIELKRRFPKARLVFTGGSGLLASSGATEADAVRRFWRAIGLDQDDVIYEDRSRNTFENAEFTKALVQPKPGERWLLVSSASHMPRSMGIFRKAGFPVIAFPVDFHTTGNVWRPRIPHSTSRGMGLTDMAAHEWIGLVISRLTGKSDALLPGS